MAKTETPREVTTKGKLVAKDLGNPKVAAGFDEKSTEKHFLGTIVGIAKGTSTRTDDTGNVYEGLRGHFRGIPAEVDKPIVESGVCYLHDGIFQTIKSEFVDEDGNEKGGEVRFAIEVYTQRATNKAGFEYAFKNLQPPTGTDPLDEFVASLPTPIKALQPPKENPNAKTS